MRPVGATRRPQGRCSRMWRSRRRRKCKALCWRWTEIVGRVGCCEGSRPSGCDRKNSYPRNPPRNPHCRQGERQGQCQGPCWVVPNESQRQARGVMGRGVSRAERCKGGPRRRKGVQEQSILGGSVFRTRRRAHDLQVIGKVSSRVEIRVLSSVDVLFVIPGRICVSFCLLSTLCISIIIVLDYDLICKNNPKWSLVLLAPGPDGHLIRHHGLFPVIQK